MYKYKPVAICTSQSEGGGQGDPETLIKGDLHIAVGSCSPSGPVQLQQGRHGYMATCHATDLPAEPRPPPFDSDEPFISLPSVSIKALQSPVCGSPSSDPCTRQKHRGLNSASHSW